MDFLIKQNTENNEENIPIKSPSYNEEENKNVLDGLIINNNVTNDEGLVGHLIFKIRQCFIIKIDP